MVKVTEKNQAGLGIIYHVTIPPICLRSLVDAVIIKSNQMQLQHNGTKHLKT